MYVVDVSFTVLLKANILYNKISWGLAISTSLKVTGELTSNSSRLGIFHVLFPLLLLLTVNTYVL